MLHARSDLVRPVRSGTTSDGALGIARRSVGDGVRRRDRARSLDDPVGTAQRRRCAPAGSIARFLDAGDGRPHSPIMRGRTLGRGSSARLDVPLDGLKRAAKTVGGSLNDSFVAAVLGGMQRYHEFHGATVDDLRMVMPINLRADGCRARRQPLHPGALPRPADDQGSRRTDRRASER